MNLTSLTWPQSRVLLSLQVLGKASWLLVLPSFSIWDVLTSGGCLGRWGKRQEQIGMHQLFLPFLYQVINGWSSFHFLESKGMLWAGWQPDLSADELLIACCHMWLVWFRRGSPSILATALSLQMYSQKREKKKIPLCLETPVTEPLSSQPGPVPVLWTNKILHLRVTLWYCLRFAEL